MKKDHLCLLWLLLIIHCAQAQQTNSRNYILSKQYKELGANPNDVSKVISKIQYFDGLGRPLQNIGVAQNPDGSDLVQPFVYDAAGRQTKNFLLYAANGKGAYQNGAAVAADAWYMANSAGLHPGDLGRPYTETIFEQSPVGRPATVRAPGNKSTISSVKHMVNAANEITRYDYNVVTGELVKNGSYGAGMLKRTQTIDEQGNETNEYTDMQGHMLCKLVLTGTETLKTQYVYDDFGQLRVVLQPNFEVAASLDGAAFVYDYDDVGRLITKRAPGERTLEIVYDKYFREVMTRDNNQKFRNVWGFSKYDALNRVIATGEVASVSDRASLQVAFDGAAAHHENSAAGGIGYTLNATLPMVAESDVLTVTYYDNYNFPKKNNLGYNAASGYYGSANVNVKSHITGKRARMLPGDGTTGAWLTEAIYYDSEYREIQTIREVYDLGADAVERVSTKYKYNLAPVVAERKTEMVLSAAATHSLVSTYAYDHADRLLSVREKVSDGTQMKEAYSLAQRYNNLGQLKSKWFHSADDFQYRLRTDYVNNIRGWMTNAKTVYKELVINPEIPYYTIGLSYVNGNNYTNGNISQLQWSGKDIASFDKGLEFVYDKANRLKEAKSPAAAPYTYAETETGIEYDKNGNIKKLKRNAASGLIDNLSYTYVGNKLFELVDASGSNVGVKNGNTGYAYDDNGNVISDGSRGATLTYNYLNLPKTIIVGGKTSTYDYDASGAKHQHIADTLILKYAGAFEYRKEGNTNKLYRIALTEGQAVYRGGKLQFEYYLKDHLGNVRVVFGEKGEILQKTDYYAFGLEIDRNVPVQAPAARAGINRYLYNGKERQVSTGYLDYGARMYDATIGRFMSVDPLEERGRCWSPYFYGFNNPTRFTDRDGMWPLDHIDVAKNNDGTYKVVGGQANSDKNIYVVDANGNRTGDVIGQMLTEYSFHSESGAPIIGSTISLTDKSGQNFIDKEVAQSNVGLLNYMTNATGGEKYDFKIRDMPDGLTSEERGQYTYRGMKYNDKIASARDIGNYAAGYVAGMYGFGWGTSRIAFDALESYQSGSVIEEGQPTQKAQRAGHDVGYKIFQLRKYEREWRRITNPKLDGPKW